MIRSDLYVESTGEVLVESLESAQDELFLVNPTRDTMEELVTTVPGFDDPPVVKLFADEDPLKDVIKDFIIASSLADLVADDVVTIRTLGDVPRSSLLLTDTFLISLVVGNARVAGLSASEESFIGSTHSHYEGRWQSAESCSLRTPPLTRIRETLEEDIGSGAVEDFDRVLDCLETARGDGDGLDEVTIALLVAANNGVLLYDVSRWGEDIRLASKATFSRSKNRLEDKGLIDTEKVPIDVGRPRLRLRLGDGELRAADIEAVAERAQEKLN
jgi:hypothetical protein